MQSAKEKISNMARTAKEHIVICKAKAEGVDTHVDLLRVHEIRKNGGKSQAGTAAARTEDEKKIAYERRKAKEAQAKMELHQAKSGHAAAPSHNFEDYKICI